EHIARERPILRQIPDYLGRSMYTEQRLFSYLQQFERDFSTSRRRIIDATEGGAMKRGAATVTLAEVISQYCSNPLTALPDDHPGYHWERLSACRQSLQRLRQEAAQIHSIGCATLPLLEEVRECLHDQNR